MKILLAPMGTDGDIRPLLALGKILREEGNDVSVCSSTDYRALAEKEAFKFYPIDLDFKEMVCGNADVVGKTISSTFRFMENLRDALDKQLAGLPPIIRKHDLIIGSGLQLGAFSIVEKYQRTYKHIIFAPNCMPSVFHTPPQFQTQFRSKTANRILWYIFKGIINSAVTNRINGYRIANNLEPVADIFKSLRDSILVSHSPNLAKIPEDCSDIKGISYLTTDSDPFPDRVDNFIEKGTPPVYIGFGSMPGDQHTVALFMDVIVDLDLRAIVQKGWAGFKANSDKRFLEVDAVSHAKLFPKTAIIVHHGGAGTTYSAAKAGVPQLVVPHFVDQFYWADRITALGVGTKVTFRQISQKRIRAAFVKLLFDKRYHIKAKELGKRIASEKKGQGVC